MSERTEHTASYWAGFGRKLLWLAFSEDWNPSAVSPTEFMCGADSGYRVWRAEERHAWAGSQDAVTRRVAELAGVVRGLTSTIDDEFTADEAAGFRMAIADAVSVLGCAGCEQFASESATTTAAVLKYIAESAESIIEDDMNESGDLSDEEHEELVRRAFEWIGAHRDPERATPRPAHPVLDLPMQPNDANASTIQEYLFALFAATWDSMKRPFGNSDWMHDLDEALVRAGHVDGRFEKYGDDYSYLAEVDNAKAYRLIQEAVNELTGGTA